MLRSCVLLFFALYTPGSPPSSGAHWSVEQCKLQSSHSLTASSRPGQARPGRARPGQARPEQAGRQAGGRGVLGKVCESETNQENTASHHWTLTVPWISPSGNFNLKEFLLLDDDFGICVVRREACENYNKDSCLCSLSLLIILRLQLSVYLLVIFSSDLLTVWSIKCQKIRKYSAVPISRTPKRFSVSYSCKRVE